MNDSNTPKQQIVEKIKNVSNVLVTVGKNPSVDELSAAIGLTLMLNKLDKHATAVFSGEIPPAITFLEPEKTLENTVDSLRDFIIALDKEKADRLRYRVEDEVVRIFITPYRTKISEDDLEFTHGDFNVELVLALGVEKQDELDEAIAAHGKILHDATVATLSARDQKSDLGSIDWCDDSASSLCEMLVSMSESLKGDTPIIDEQIATAYLTGIVSATNRFSNDYTSPKAMTMAAQLMAAGANQQLIAAELEESDDISPHTDPLQSSDDSHQTEAELKDGEEQKIEKDSRAPINKEKKDLGEMTISHEESTSSEEKSESTLQELPKVKSATVEEHDRVLKREAGEQALDTALEQLGELQPAQPNLEAELAEAAREQADDETPSRQKLDVAEEPTMGGTFSATSKEAHDDAIREQASAQNKILMSHDGTQPISSDGEPVSTKGRDILPPSQDNILPQSNTALDENRSDMQGETLADIEANIQKRKSGLPQSSSSIPPLPDFSTLPPLPPDMQEISSSPSVSSATPQPIPPPVNTDPTQFKIPGN
jgi:hypothetical protein